MRKTIKQKTKTCPRVVAWGKDILTLVFCSGSQITSQIISLAKPTFFSKAKLELVYVPFFSPFFFCMCFAGDGLPWSRHVLWAKRHLLINELKLLNFEQKKNDSMSWVNCIHVTNHAKKTFFVLKLFFLWLILYLKFFHNYGFWPVEFLEKKNLGFLKTPTLSRPMFRDRP